MKQNEVAAIIGYWRNGMTHEEISLATDLSTVVIDEILRNYFKNKK